MFRSWSLGRSAVGARIAIDAGCVSPFSLVIPILRVLVRDRVIASEAGERRTHRDAAYRRVTISIRWLKFSADLKFSVGLSRLPFIALVNTRFYHRVMSARGSVSWGSVQCATTKQQETKCWIGKPGRRQRCIIYFQVFPIIYYVRYKLMSDVNGHLTNLPRIKRQNRIEI